MSIFIWTQFITVKVFTNQFASFSNPETLHLSEEQDSFENNLLLSACIYSYTAWIRIDIYLLCLLIYS